jgi:hypothetical protein
MNPLQLFRFSPSRSRSKVDKTGAVRAEKAGGQEAAGMRIAHGARLFAPVDRILSPLHSAPQ